MKLFDAYNQAIDEDEDPAEREEFSSSIEIKTLVREEIMTAMKETRDARVSSKTPVDMIKPLFGCVAFWFIIGIRIGKILRDAELKEQG